MMHKKILNIHIPKTGGISFRNALNNMPEHILKTGHRSAFNQMNRFKDDWHEWIKTSTVRHPLDRMVSLYFHAIQNVKKTNLPDFNTWIEKNIYSRRNELLDVENTIKTTVMVKPQFYWLSDGHNILVDRILKFESYEDDFNKFVKDYEIKHRKLGRFNTSKHGHWKSYYSKQTLEMMGDLYKIDLKTFNYKI